MRIHPAVVMLLVVSLAGCSGSSSGDGVSTPDSSGSAGQLLGSRSVPGGTITVSSAGPVQPGATNVFRLVTSAGMPAPTTVQAWIGLAYDPTVAGIQATPSANTPGVYDVALTVPSPLAAGSHVWVRLSFADGSVVETGSEDFLLAGQ